MKLSKDTLEILKNFSQINPNLVVQPGNRIRSVTADQTLLADAEVEEEFPVKVCIYNLTNFISILSLYKEPDIDFSDKYMTITEGRKKTKYFYASEGMVVAPPESEIKLPEVTVKVKLTWNDLSSTMKAAGIYSFETVAFVGDGEKVYIQAIDPEKTNSSTDTFGVELGETNDVFKLVIKIANLRLMNRDYEVEISPAGLCSLKNENVTYFVPFEAKDSKYERK